MVNEADRKAQLIEAYRNEELSIWPAKLETVDVYYGTDCEEYAGSFPRAWFTEQSI